MSLEPVPDYSYRPTHSSGPGPIQAAAAFQRTAGYVRQHMMFPSVEDQDLQVLEDMKSAFLAQEAMPSPLDSQNSPHVPNRNLRPHASLNRQSSSPLSASTSLPQLRPPGTPPYSPKGKLGQDASKDSSSQLASPQSSEELVLPMISLHTNASLSSSPPTPDSASARAGPMAYMSRLSSQRAVLVKQATNVFPVNLQRPDPDMVDCLRVDRSASSCFDLEELRREAALKSSSKVPSLFKKLFKGSSSSPNLCGPPAPPPAPRQPEPVPVQKQLQSVEEEPSNVDDLRKLRTNSTATLHTMRVMARLNCRW